MDICWLDMGTPDPDAATAFYGALFGWTYGDPDRDGYRIARGEDGRELTGLGPAEDPGPPYWTVVLRVDDIDASAREAMAKGARLVVPPTRLGDRGHTCVAVDPFGAPISLWQPGTQAGTDVADFATVTLCTDRPDEARAFYGPTVRTTPSEHPSWLVTFKTDATVETARSLGATQVTATTLRDPAGAVFAIQKAGPIPAIQKAGPIAGIEKG